jgi:hypothetical protein
VKEVAIKVSPFCTPVVKWISDGKRKDLMKERARIKFASLYPDVPCENQDLVPTEEGLLRGYWRPSIAPSRIEGNTIYYQC